MTDRRVAEETIEMNKLWIKNVTIKMWLVNANRIPELIDLIKEGKINKRPLITPTLPLSIVAEGNAIFEERRDNALKVVVKGEAYGPQARLRRAWALSLGTGPSAFLPWARRRVGWGRRQGISSILRKDIQPV